MTSYKDIVFIAIGGLIVSQILKALHLIWKEYFTKKLYVDEVKCPVCRARPHQQCHQGPIFVPTHSARWDAADVENDKREQRRESSVAH